MEIEEILKKADNCYMIIKTNNEIIYPINNNEKNYIYNIINNKANNTNEIFYNNKWFEYSKKIINFNNQEVTIETLFDITKYKDCETNYKMDCVTNLYNRQTFENEFNKYLDYLKYNNENFLVIMADIDFFKKTNDTYGHIVGDLVLNKISENLKNNIRTNENREKDIIGRYGGEEFVIIIKNIDKNDAIKKAEILRKNISNLTINYNNKIIENITISLGIIHLNSCEINFNYDYTKIKNDILNKADQALYYSKNNGRNKTTLYN